MAYSDTITVLRSLDGAVEAKVFAAGAKEARPIRPGSKFAVEVHGFKDIGELSALLTGLETKSDRLIIRDDPRPGVDPENAKRDAHHFTAVPKRWFCIDIDKLAMPEGVDLGNLQGLAQHAIHQLPNEFHDVSCHYQFSSSMGLVAGLTKVHLFFCCDRPVSDVALRDWLKGSIADQALFRPVQMIFTAAPIFERPEENPLPTRSGFIEGHSGEVAVPEFNTAPTLGHVTLIKRPGTQGDDRSKGQMRLDLPGIVRNEQGLAIDGREQLLFQISHQVAAQLIRNDRSNLPTVKELADAIEARFWIEALNDGRWTRADFETKARDRLRDSERGFHFRARGSASPLIPGLKAPKTTNPVAVDQGRSWLGGLLHDQIQAIMDGNGWSAAYQVTPGTGKTRTTAHELSEEYRSSPDMHVAVYTPRQNLAQDFVGALTTHQYVDVRVIKGMIDNSDITKSLCLRAPYVKGLVDRGISVRPHACFKSADTKCVHYSVCPYWNQFRASNDLTIGSVRVYTHTNLKFERHPDEPEPDIIIIDEGFLTAIYEYASLPISNLRYGFFDEHGSFVGDRIAKAFEMGEPVLDVLRELGIEGQGPDLVSFKSPTVAFDGSSVHDTAGQTGEAARITRAKNALMNILVEELTLGDRHHLTRAHYNPTTQSIEMGWLAPLAIGPASVIVLDATADQRLLEKVLDRDLKLHRIDVVQNAHVTQVYDKTGSNAFWNDDLEPAEREHFQELISFANEQVRGGGKVLIISHKALADNLRQEASLDQSIQVDHFGNVRGTNRYEDCDTIIITGRHQPPPDYISSVARAVWWDDIAELTKDSHESVYGDVGYVVRDEHEPFGTTVRRFRDDRVEAVQRQLREAETIQGVERIRLVNAVDTKKVFLLSSLPLALRVDALVAWNDLMSNEAERELLDKGNFPITPANLLRIRPDLVKTSEQAREYLRRNSRIKDTKARLPGSPALARTMVAKLSFKQMRNGRPYGRTQEHLFVIPYEPKHGNYVMDVEKWVNFLEQGEAGLSEGWGEIGEVEID